MRKTRKQLPFLSGIKCDLTGTDLEGALSVLGGLRERVLTTLRMHAFESETQSLNNGPVQLKKFESLAWGSYLHATQRMPPASGSAEEDVWNWLKEHPIDEYALPKYETWVRYISAAKRQTHQLPPSDRTGRSLISSEEAFTQERDRKKG